MQPKPGVSQARRGQRRVRVKLGGHRGGEGGHRGGERLVVVGGRIGCREAPTDSRGLDGRFVQA